jgi:hypothetical protein
MKEIANVNRMEILPEGFNIKYGGAPWRLTLICIHLHPLHSQYCRILTGLLALTSRMLVVQSAMEL